MASKELEEKAEKNTQLIKEYGELSRKLREKQTLLIDVYKSCGFELSMEDVLEFGYFE